MLTTSCLACDQPVGFSAMHYCDACGCAWCGGNATGPESIEDRLGRVFCDTGCEQHYYAWKAAEAKEA